jgi:hypothetical protein
VESRDAGLGTLAEAETLPCLVSLIGDSDADIAAAAKDAVNRINQASKKK